jgi:hypothetical protein
VHGPAEPPFQVDFKPFVIEITDLPQWVNSQRRVEEMSVMAHAGDSSWVRE